MASDIVPFTAASKACLDTTELLEAILMWLDTQTLLLSQRVCHKFQNVITNNSTLKERLFLFPATLEDIAEADSILVEPLSDAEMMEERLSTMAHKPDSQYAQRATLNPLFFNLPRW